MANAKDQEKGQADVAREAEATLGPSVAGRPASRELVAATEAETDRVRKAWEAGERIPEGFYVNFGQQGGETVLFVRKRA